MGKVSPRLLSVIIFLIWIGALYALIGITTEENSEIPSPDRVISLADFGGEGYVYIYHMRGSGFMTFSEDGVGVICPERFGAFYGVDLANKKVFIKTENLTLEARKKLKDPYLIVDRILKDQRSRVIKEKNGTRVLELYWNTSEKYGQEILITHYTLRVALQNDFPVEASKEYKYNVVNDSPYTSIDYVDTAFTYTIRKIYCWADIFGMTRVYLKWLFDNMPKSTYYSYYNISKSTRYVNDP